MMLVKGVDGSITEIYNIFNDGFYVLEPDSFIFSAEGFYQISIYFESYEEYFYSGIFISEYRPTNYLNHRMDYSFYVIPTHDTSGKVNSIKIKNSNGIGDVPKNGVVQSGGTVDTNGFKYITVKYRNYGLSSSAITSEIGNGYGIAGAGYNNRAVYRGTYRAGACQ